MSSISLSVVAPSGFTHTSEQWNIIKENVPKCPLPSLIYKNTVSSVKVIYTNKSYSFRIELK
jgi:hypothetical protein